MYVYMGNVVASFFPLIICMYIYIVGGKRQIDYQFIPTDLFRGCPLIRGFVCIYIHTYINIMRGKKDATTFPDKPVS